MENITKLYIKEPKEYIEPENIRFESLESFFDIKSGICIQKMYIEANLEVGFVYDFTYEDYDDSDTYSFVILKREGNIYYITKYYGNFCQQEERYLGDCWVKCDVKDEIGIDVEEWKTKKIYDAQTPDMRLKVEEYITELNQEIDRCILCIEESMSGDACLVSELEGRLKALTEVKNDLQGRLDELI